MQFTTLNFIMIYQRTKDNIHRHFKEVNIHIDLLQKNVYSSFDYYYMIAPFYTEKH